MSTNRVSIHNYQSVLRIIVVEVSLENHLHYLYGAVVSHTPQHLNRVRMNVEMRLPAPEPISDALRYGVKQIGEWFGQTTEPAQVHNVGIVPTRHVQRLLSV